MHHTLQQHNFRPRRPVSLCGQTSARLGVGPAGRAPVCAMHGPRTGCALRAPARPSCLEGSACRFGKGGGLRCFSCAEYSRALRFHCQSDARAADTALLRTLYAHLFFWGCICPVTLARPERILLPTGYKLRQRVRARTRTLFPEQGVFSPGEATVASGYILCAFFGNGAAVLRPFVIVLPICGCANRCSACVIYLLW